MHQKKPETLGYHHVEGYQDPSTWAKVRGGVKMHTNLWTPCMCQILQSMHGRNVSIIYNIAIKYVLLTIVKLILEKWPFDQVLSS